MKKYKVNKEEKGRQITDEEILKFKDFTNLQQQYEMVTKRGKPLYRRPVFFFVLILIILLVLMLTDEL